MKFSEKMKNVSYDIKSHKKQGFTPSQEVKKIQLFRGKEGIGATALLGLRRFALWPL